MPDLIPFQYNHLIFARFVYIMRATFLLQRFPSYQTFMSLRAIKSGQWHNERPRACVSILQRPLLKLTSLLTTRSEQTF